jgi:hypothetical protein
MIISSDTEHPCGLGPGHSRDSGLHDAALLLASKGWFVFPCMAGAKRPALHNWERLATTDPGRIARWWQPSRCNIGIACGPSGLIVLDLDLPHLPQPASTAAALDGSQRLALLCNQHAQPYPSDTFAVRTPSGGQHLYFTSGEQTLRNTAGRLAPLIDTRAAGGYVLGPGSLISGRRYTITSPLPPLPLPRWLASLLTDSDSQSRGSVDIHLASSASPGYALAALRRESLCVTSAPVGTRNDTLNRAAFSLGQLAVAGLLPTPLVRDTLARAAQQAGLPAREANATIRSGLHAGARKPRRGPS